MIRLSVILALIGLFGARGSASGQQETPPPTLPNPLALGDPDPPFPTPFVPPLFESGMSAPSAVMPLDAASNVPPESSPPRSPDDPDMIRVHPNYLPNVWGYAGFRAIASGDKMAPNGEVYLPLGTLDVNLNIGLLPRKRLYVYTIGSFWAQKATPGVTNPTLGQFDFSKRQMDLLIGAAWNYWGFLEARVTAYAYNNLNRGMQLDKPYGYNDGVIVENRYYIPKSNLYDLPRLNFLSIGYYTSKELTGADGVYFEPGLFAQAYLTYEFVPRRYYVYADTEMICQRVANPRLLLFDDGFAARPFPRLEGLEFRLGVFNTADVQVDNVRTLIYGTVQVIF